MKKAPITIAGLQILISAVCLSISFCSTANATQYYVSTTSGKDTNSGTSALPFQTIQKCANVTKAGDTCNIHAGTYREAVNVITSGSASAPITFTGVPGETATISGADLITNWTQYSGNIYVANVSFTTPPTQLYVDGQFYDIAHYPNSGYLTATANSSDIVSIIDSNLTLTPNQIVGATVITRSDPWDISSDIATAYNNTTHTITLNGSLDQAMRTQYGFYLQNMLWMLDAPGEWFYDSTAGKIYLWTANSDNPNNHAVEVSSRSYGITEGGRNYVTIQNLAIANANQYDVYIGNANNVTLNNLSISGGLMGIQSFNMTNFTIQNNSVLNPLSNGIYLNGSNNVNVNISNNTINNAGNVGTPKQSVGGIVIGGTSATNMNISGNTITKSGYSGLWYMGNLITVEKNIIDKSCLVLDDCAGIYTYNANEPAGWTSTISDNTVTNSIGNFSGTAYTNTQAQGIYLDALSNGYTVSNNNIYNADFGIYIHTGYNNTVNGNKVYGARMYGLLLTEDNSGGYAGEVAGAVHNNIITGNTIETIANSNLNYWPGSGAADYYSQFGSTISNFGTFNNNQYCHPNINFAVGTRNINNISNYSLSNWQQATRQDLNSTDTNSSCDPQVTLTLTEPTAGGTITSAPVGINCTSSCSASFNSGTDVILIAVPNSGFTFSGWSGVCSGTDSCSVTMNAAQNVTANFIPQYTLTVSTTGSGFGVVFGNGIDCGVEETACSQTLTNGTVATLTATAANYYVFSGWSGACSGIGNCTVTMNANTSVSASFNPQTYTVTSSAGTGGTITPSGAVSVNYGTNQTFTITPNTGYTAQLTIDGTAVTLTNNTYTLSNVTTTHMVTASFSLQTETITASAGTGGTITPSGAVSVNYGTNQTFTVSPSAGYTPSLTVDGTVVSLTNYTYTLSNITSAHTVVVSFTLQTKIISANASTGGTITPSGMVSVNYGSSQTFIVSPTAGYAPVLTVDGTAVILTNNTYTLINVTTSHSVVASFSLPTISPDGTVLNAGSAGNLFTNAGTWTFSSSKTGSGNIILLNGKSAAGGSAVLLLVYNKGKLYVENKSGKWYLWNNSAWQILSGDPRLMT